MPISSMSTPALRRCPMDSDETPDNPDYLTITDMPDRYCVCLMRYNPKEDVYQIDKCIPYKSRTQALRVMIDWADNDKLEVR